MDKLTAAQVFLDVALTQSFTATADRLDISRPMVTRHIETMESWLQTRLLNRTTRKVSLTTAGEQCLEAIKLWVEQAQQLEHQLMDSQSLAGKIRIAADPDPSLIGRPIAKCESILVAAPSYLAAHPAITQPSDLAQHACLGYKNFERHIWHLTQDEVLQSVEVSCRLTANEATTLLHAAVHGMGIALQPTYLTSGALAKGEVVSVLADWQPKTMSIYALYPSRRHLSPAVRALIDHLADYFSSHDWQDIVL